jgi:hypothetical protein
VGAAEGHLDEDGVVGMQVAAGLDVHVGEPGDQPLPQLTHGLGPFTCPASPNEGMS